MKNLSFIAVSGFFSSGSSAVVDLLKEYRNTYECEAEIRLIKDPYGISQLEQALTTRWELLNSSAAIRDFLWLCKVCNRKSNNPFSPAGLSYSAKIGPDFMKFTGEYINALTDYTYKSDFFYQKFKKPYLKYVIDRWRMGIEFYTKGRIRAANRNISSSWFSHPGPEKFRSLTVEYLEKLFEPCIGESDEGFVILDQAISTNDTQAIHRYFRNAKLIIVDRDPRDMYVEDLVRWRENLDKDTSSAQAGHRYVLRHRALRQDIPDDDADVLQIRFEDIIVNYESVKSRIEQFLGFSGEDHVMKNKYLRPEISKKNIGIWQQYHDVYKDAIDTIACELSDYLWVE